MLIMGLVVTASLAGSFAFAKKALKFAFLRPKVSMEKFHQIPFKELAQTATLSRLAYADPSNLKSHLLNYKDKDLIDESMLEDQKFYDGNPISDTQAYVWWMKDKKKVYVCFRGTSNVSDAIADIDVRYHTFDIDEDEPNIKVHNGFYTQLMAVYDNISKDLLARTEDFDTIIVGSHSLGAACSTLAACKLVKDFPDKQVHCHTFGCPRVGNNEFVKWFNQHVKHNWRVFNEQDPVSMVPLSFRFTHVDNGICIDDNGNVKEAKQDYPWWLRIFASLPAIDYNAPIQDHDCDLYIERLNSYTRLEKT